MSPQEARVWVWKEHFQNLHHRESWRACNRSQCGWCGRPHQSTGLSYVYLSPAQPIPNYVLNIIILGGTKRNELNTTCMSFEALGYITTLHSSSCSTSRKRVKAENNYKSKATPILNHNKMKAWADIPEECNKGWNTLPCSPQSFSDNP